jgi:hypothetical protein
MALGWVLHMVASHTICLGVNTLRARLHRHTNCQQLYAAQEIIL